jgi:putative ABC transport system permease protein
MSVVQSIAVSLRALTVNKMRAGLTMLGIIIGISAVIILVSVGQGVQSAFAQQMQSIGSNLVFVLPGGLEQSATSMRSMLRSVNVSTLTYGDSLALTNRALAPDLLYVAPEFVANGTVVFGGESVQTSISGVTPSYAAARGFYPEVGAFISSDDLRSRARVAVLGRKVATSLFPPNIQPVGQVVKINRVPFRVVGVMEKKGTSAYADDNDVVFVPLSTAQSRLFSGRDLAGDYTASVIYAQAVDESRMDAARDQITRILRQRHGLVYSSDENDFAVLTQNDVGEALRSLTTILTMFLGLIAAVSLLVGGIGVMNIMLVSVTERTREIGIRKAVGAKERDILLQFLMEAVVLSLFGGLIGIAIGVLGTIGASAAMKSLTLHLSPATILLATGFSTLVGLFFGIYPAVRASRLNPIEALRYE